MLLAKKDAKGVSVTPKNLEKFLGVRRFRYGKAEDENRIGQVTGLAWTEVGGELLTIEAAVVPGKGKLQHTGQLGEVMQESIQAAMTVVRSRAQVLGLEPEFYQKHDVHLHIPEGATPKDGPSAGVAMFLALVSLLKDRPVRSDVAMTGEISLRGLVLPIGGVKEKTLAALRAGIKTVMLPRRNERDLEDVPKEAREKLEFVLLDRVEDALRTGLGLEPEELRKAA
jgi:ATP-dependent Lon protease